MKCDEGTKVLEQELFWPHEKFPEKDSKRAQSIHNSFRYKNWYQKIPFLTFERTIDSPTNDAKEYFPTCIK